VIAEGLAVLVGTGMRLDEALHLMWTDVDLQHRMIHVHRGRRGAPNPSRLRHVPISDWVLSVLLAKSKNTALARREARPVRRATAPQ